MLNTNQPFRLWLKQQRKAHRFTQTQLAEHLNCTESMVRKLEAGTRTPSLLIARKMAHIFNIDAAEYPLFISWSVQNQQDIADSHTIEVQAHTKTHSVVSSPRLLTVTTLIGREQELYELEQFIHERCGRLLTIVGPAGAGKTSLALVVAKKLQTSYKVVQIDLDALESSDLVLLTISQHLGFGTTSERVIQAAFQHILGAEAILLLLDTFEHVLGASSVISDMLRWCPNMIVIVTSQAPLQLAEEQIYQLEPLTTPSGTITSLEQLAQSTAGQLLLERLWEQRPSWPVTNKHAADLGTICRYLDGLPLAIELVATRLRWLTPQSMLEFLEKDYQIVERTATNHLQRHQSLASAIQRSYELLPHEAQQLFCCLSIFADGWSLAEAYGIYTGQVEHTYNQDREFRELIELLLERGMILPLATNADRFRMLRALMIFGQATLEQSEPTKYELLCRRHSNYYLTQAEHINQQEQDQIWFQRMSDLLANCKQALQRNLVQGNAEQAARIALNYNAYWYRKEAWREALYWFEKIYRLPINDQKIALQIGRWYANMLHLLRESATALEVLFPILQTYEQAEDWAGLQATLSSLASASRILRHYLEARRYLHSACYLAQEYIPHMRIYMQHNLAVLAATEGYYAEAIQISLNIQPDIEASSHGWLKCQFWINMTWFYSALDQAEQVLWATEQAEAINQEIQSIPFHQDILQIKIFIVLAEQRLSEAMNLAVELYKLLPQAEDNHTIISCLITWAAVLTAHNQAQVAVPIITAFRHWIELELIVLDLFQTHKLSRLEIQLEQFLTHPMYAIWVQQGKLLTVEQALKMIGSALALAE